MGFIGRAESTDLWRWMLMLVEMAVDRCLLLSSSGMIYFYSFVMVTVVCIIMQHSYSVPTLILGIN